MVLCLNSYTGRFSSLNLPDGFNKLHGMKEIDLRFHRIAFERKGRVKIKKPISFNDRLDRCGFLENK